MATIYIDTVAGSDASPDATNPATPVQTIGEAQTRATVGDSTFGSGDTIKYLNAGPVPPIPISTKAGLTYEAADGGTEVDATGQSRGVYLYNGQTARGFTVHSSTGDGIVGYTASTSARRVRAVDCTAHGNAGHGFSIVAPESEIHRCIAHDNGGRGFQTGNNGSYTLSVVLAFDNGTGGVRVSGAGAVLEHATAFGNAGATYAIEVSSNAVARSCIAVDNPTAYGIGSDLDDVTNSWSFSSNRSLYHTTADFFGGATPTGCGTTDPLLTDPLAGDFTLQVGSPCIGTGVTGLATVDLAGVDFTDPPSMGAYEAALPPDPRNRWDPRVAGLYEVTSGWSGSVKVTVDGAETSVTPRARTSAAEVWEAVLARVRRLHGEATPWEAWADATGKLTLVGEELTEAGFRLAFTGNAGERLGFDESGYEGQLQYTSEAGPDGLAAFGVDLIADGAPAVALAEAAAVADGSLAPSTRNTASTVTLWVYDAAVTAFGYRALVGRVFDILGPGARWLGRLQVRGHRVVKRGQSSGAPVMLAELRCEAVAL